MNNSRTKWAAAALFAAVAVLPGCDTDEQSDAEMRVLPLSVTTDDGVSAFVGNYDTSTDTIKLLPSIVAQAATTGDSLTVVAGDEAVALDRGRAVLPTSLVEGDIAVIQTSGARWQVTIREADFVDALTADEADVVFGICSGWT